LGLNLLDDLLTFSDLAEDDVLAIQPWTWNGGDEELGSVGVWTSVGHGQEVWLGVLELEVLVLELFAVDGLSTGAVVVGKVTTLQHELRDDTVEDGVPVAKALLASAESSEVFGGLWDNVVFELKDDLASWGSTDGDVEVYFGHAAERS